MRKKREAFLRVWNQTHRGVPPLTPCSSGMSSEKKRNSDICVMMDQRHYALLGSLRSREP